MTRFSIENVNHYVKAWRFCLADYYLQMLKEPHLDFFLDMRRCITYIEHFEKYGVDWQNWSIKVKQ